MTSISWRIEPLVQEEGSAAERTPPLVSLRFLRAAVLRHWKFCASAALCGLLLGALYSMQFPVKSTATVVVLLTHDPNADPTRAMSTDTSLLSTRAVATRAIKSLHLSLTPEQLLQSVTARAATDEVLVLKISAPDDAAAVSRGQTFADSFLRYRATQMQAQTGVLINGYTDRIQSLQAQVTELTKRYNSLVGGSGAAQGEASDVLTLRSQLNAQVATLQQSIEDATLRATYVQNSSHILDPATANPTGGKRRTALNLVAGLIGGTALGIGIVILLAITSDRLRRRDDVATALGVPVGLSLGPLHRRWSARLLLPGRRRAVERDRWALADKLDGVFTEDATRRVKLAIVSIDSPEAARLAVAELAARLSTRLLDVFAIDLSETGGLDHSVQKALSRSGDPELSDFVEVWRPEGVPTLARGPLGLPYGVVSQLQEDDRRVWDKADETLTLADVDPTIGADHLTSWADHAVIVVTAGRTSAERMRTSADLVRATGIRVLFAVLVDADPSDDSLGYPGAVWSDRDAVVGVRNT